MLTRGGFREKFRHFAIWDILNNFHVLTFSIWCTDLRESFPVQIYDYFIIIWTSRLTCTPDILSTRDILTKILYFS